MPQRDADSRRKYQQTYHKRTYTPDTQEKKALWSGRLKVSVLARIQRITQEGIATGKFPWKTNTQTVEALLLRGLESLANDPDIAGMLPYLRAIGHIDNIGAHRVEAQAAFSKLKTEISELESIKAHDQAVQYFHSCYAAFEEMDETVWRDWLLTKLRTTFPKLVTEKPKSTQLFLKVAERRHAKDTPDRRRPDRPKRTDRRHRRP